METGVKDVETAILLACYNPLKPRNARFIAFNRFVFYVVLSGALIQSNYRCLVPLLPAVSDYRDTVHYINNIGV